MPKRIIYHIGDISRQGMERIIVLKANWLAEHGYQVTMLSMSSLVESFSLCHLKSKWKLWMFFKGVYMMRNVICGGLEKCVL